MPTECNATIMNYTKSDYPVDLRCFLGILSYCRKCILLESNIKLLSTNFVVSWRTTDRWPRVPQQQNQHFRIAKQALHKQPCFFIRIQTLHSRLQLTHPTSSLVPQWKRNVMAKETSWILLTEAYFHRNQVLHIRSGTTSHLHCNQILSTHAVRQRFRNKNDHESLVHAFMQKLYKAHQDNSHNLTSCLNSACRWFTSKA